MGNKISSRPKCKNAKSRLSSPCSLSSPARFNLSNRFQSYSLKKEKLTKTKKKVKNILNKNLKEVNATSPFDSSTCADICDKSSNNACFSSLSSCSKTQEITVMEENGGGNVGEESKNSSLNSDGGAVYASNGICNNKLDCMLTFPQNGQNDEVCNDSSASPCNTILNEDENEFLNKLNIYDYKNVNLSCDNEKFEEKNEEDEKFMSDLHKMEGKVENEKEKENNIELEIDSNWLPPVSSIDFYVAENKNDCHSDIQRLTGFMYTNLNDECREVDGVEEEEENDEENLKKKNDFEDSFYVDFPDESDKMEVSSLIAEYGFYKKVDDDEKSCDLSPKRETEIKELEEIDEEKSENLHLEKSVCEESLTNSSISHTCFKSSSSLPSTSPSSIPTFHVTEEKKVEQEIESVKKEDLNIKNKTSKVIVDAHNSLIGNDEFSPNFLMEPTRTIQLWFNDILLSCTANHNSNQGESNNRTELVVGDMSAAYVTDTKTTTTCDDSHATYSSSLSHNSHYDNNNGSISSKSNINNNSLYSNDYTNVCSNIAYEQYNIATPLSSPMFYNNGNYKNNKDKNDENVLHFLPSEDPTGYLTDSLNV